MSDEMQFATTCNVCGRSIPEDAPDGCCPACMLGAALAPEGQESVAATVVPADPPPAHPRSPYPFDAGNCVGDYEILDEIGRGGMGVVYRAHQVSLNRVVALKIIGAGRLASEAEVTRFQIEAETAARLDHPNVVAVHEVADHQGQCFFTMQYVPGRNLSDLMKSRTVSVREAARYIHEVALAIAHAHRHNVLHRDLKPSNVLIDAAGHARVTDFGLAKHLADDSEITVSGQILGTPSYMSPEQAGARQSQVGPATDIYSTGALLYHLLTGRPPFQGDTPMETMVQVREHDPVLPRVYNPEIPRNLEMICMKCLEKRPKHRYPAARALARDLHRFLEGEAVSLSSVKLFDRLVQALERGHYDVEMRSWGTMCMRFAVIVVTAHVLIFVQTQTRGPPPHSLAWVAGTRAWEFLGIMAVMWFHRRDCYPPRSLPSRQIWALWAAYLGGSVVLAFAGMCMTPAEPYDPLTLYPQLAVLSGLGFLVMGSSYWGGCYLIGASLMALALVFLLPGMLAWAPLIFGFTWGASLLALGRRLRMVAGE